MYYIEIKKPNSNMYVLKNRTETTDEFDLDEFDIGMFYKTRQDAQKDINKFYKKKYKGLHLCVKAY